MSDFNDKIIADFRAHEGKVGPPFEGADMVIITTTGARSGEQRENPLVCFPDGDHVDIVASAAGAPKHPAWFHNLVANPTATVERGTDTYQADAEVLDGAERQRVWDLVVAAMPGFADYQAKAEGRVIPIIALHRQG